MLEEVPRVELLDGDDPQAGQALVERADVVLEVEELQTLSIRALKPVFLNSLKASKPDPATVEKPLDVRAGSRRRC